MANELNINLASFSFAKSTITINIAPLPSPLAVTVTGLHSVHDQVVLSTGDSTLTKGNIGTIGYVFVRNLDATNSIQLSADATLYPVLLKPLEIGVFRWNAAAFHAKASTGTPTLEYMLIED